MAGEINADAGKPSADAVTALPRRKSIVARWSRNLATVGYLASTVAFYLMDRSGSGILHRYSHDDDSMAGFCIAFHLAAAGLIALAIGVLGWALAARRPWRFGIRGLLAATVLFAIPILPSFRVLQHLDVDLGGGVAAGFTVFFNFSGDGDPSFLFFEVAIGALAALFAIMVAIAGLPLAVAAMFRRGRRWWASRLRRRIV